jgi:3-hydroxybutyryl-CoA dehydratase
MSKDYFEDCHVGEKSLSPGRTMTETDVVFFAAFTGDWLSIHTDAEYAKNSVFGERIAHGMLVLTVGSALLLRQGDHALLPKATIALYEIEKVRFVAPTKIGDTLHTESEIIRMTAVDRSRGLIVIRGEIKNQRDEIVATFRLKGLVGRRPTEP